jgi:protein-L-isoaspartate(D-aspartate) O-methyltransferase
MSGESASFLHGQRIAEVLPASEDQGLRYSEPMADAFAAARDRMVDTQLARRDIRDPRVLDAMRAVPRHLFVPPDLANEAYGDHPVPIGFGQTISQPYIVAWMIEQLRLTPQSRVLEVGAGCGYQTAILARLAREVFAVEIIDALTARARATLEALGVKNVRLSTRDGSLGWPERAPFDAIVVAAAAPDVPPALVEQLADGGRLIIPVGGEDFQTLRLVQRDGTRVTEEELVDVRFVPLVAGNRQ